MKKTCPKCNTEQDKEAFGRDNTRKDGRSRLCKKCTYEYNKERKLRIKQDFERYF